MMKIVGLAGAAGSGKDTAAAGLVAAGWKRIALADPMRAMLLKIDPLVNGFRLSKAVETMGWDRAKREYPEVRRLLIACGEGARSVLGADCWLRAAEKTSEWRSGDDLVISDIRPHDGQHLTIEVDWIHQHGGSVIRVDRKQADGDKIQHYTETNLHQLPVDAVAVNSGTVEDLHATILRLVEEIG